MGRAMERTNLQTHFVHLHVQEIVVIPEEGTPPQTPMSVLLNVGTLGGAEPPPTSNNPMCTRRGEEYTASGGRGGSGGGSDDFPGL